MASPPFPSLNKLPLQFILLLLLSSAAAPLPPQNCKLPNGPNAQSDVALGFPRIANRMRTTGLVNYSVLFVDFSDAPSPDSAATVFARLAPAAPNYYKELSRGAMQPLFSPLLTTLRMSKPSTSYNIQTEGGQRNYLTEATQLAISLHGWDFSSSDSVIAMASTAATALPNGPAFCAEPGGGFVASGKTFENSVTSGHDFTHWGSSWFNHESGHTMGLVDLYTYHGGAEFQFTGDWSLMGNIAGAGNEYFGWERWLLSWLNDTEILCAGATSEAVTLVPLESPTDTPDGSYRAAVSRTGMYTAVVAEARSASAHDSGIPQPGMLVYFMDTSLASGNGTLRVLPLNSSGNMLRATLTAGKSITYDGVQVNVVSIGADGGAVITMVSACSTFNCPPPGACGADGKCSA